MAIAILIPVVYLEAHKFTCLKHMLQVYEK